MASKGLGETSGFRDKYVQLAKTIELFIGLSPDQLVKIMSLGVTEAAMKGTVIFKKGLTSRKMYVILEGEVDIMDGDKLIATLGKGEMFGEMGLLSGEPRNATAVARESSSFFILTEQSLHRLFTKRVAIVLLMNIIRKLSDRLREADEFVGFKQ